MKSNANLDAPAFTRSLFRVKIGLSFPFPDDPLLLGVQTRLTVEEQYWSKSMVVSFYPQQLIHTYSYTHTINILDNRWSGQVSSRLTTITPLDSRSTPPDSFSQRTTQNSNLRTDHLPHVGTYPFSRNTRGILTPQ